MFHSLAVRIIKNTFAFIIFTSIARGFIRVVPTWIKFRVYTVSLMQCGGLRRVNGTRRLIVLVYKCSFRSVVLLKHIISTKSWRQYKQRRQVSTSVAI